MYPLGVYDKLNKLSGELGMTASQTTVHLVLNALEARERVSRLSDTSTADLGK
jgi:macrodomain Ter protein organizer (MatP/YcbG family)